ncbi:MAG: class I SAM-dependent methyltransferase [Defluviitaleaceae bacterium]|nr:class I SAM-dependent methyltransferase [Defluviitaleaceae bacterium]
MNIAAFTGRAKAYAEARPSYPDEAVEYICKLVPQGATFADIGAGTGKFTELIARCGYEIFAVEPNSDMREQLTITLASFPNAKIINGTAEATTLPKNCVEVITNAQALRRFDLGMFRAECLRIGKPNPIVVSIWNDETTLSPAYEKITEIFYRNPEVRKFPNPVYFTREKWLLNYSSMEGVPLEGDTGYEAYTTELNERFDHGSKNGILRLDFVTYVYSERIV